MEARQDSNCLPSAVTSTIPSCAIGCVQSFISSNYDQTSCSFTSDLTSLCVFPTKSGLTLGEGGLECVLSNCPSGSNPQIYNVCNNVVGAQSKTAATLSASQTSSATSSQSTSAGATTTATTQQGGIPATASFVYITGSGPYLGDPTSTPSPSSSSSSSSSHLSTAAVAGIAVGSAIGALLLITLLVWFCVRKRRSNAPAHAPRHYPSKSWSETSSFLPLNKNLPLPDPSGQPSTWLQSAWLASSANRMDAIAELDNDGNGAPLIIPKTFKTSHGSGGLPVAENNGPAPPTTENMLDSQRRILAAALHRGSVGPSGKPSRFSPSEASAPSDGETDLLSELDGSSTTTIVQEKDSLLSGVSGESLKHHLPSAMRQPKPGRYPFLDTIPDTEAQTSQPSSTRGSIASSARASIAAMTASLARAMSIKREKPVPTAVPAPGRAATRATKAVNKYPLTPKYDNGTFEPVQLTTTQPKQAFLPSTRPPPKDTRKPTFSSFLRGPSSQGEAQTQPSASRPGLPRGANGKWAHGQSFDDAVRGRSGSNQGPAPSGLVRSPSMPAPLAFSRSRNFSKSSLDESTHALRDITRAKPTMATTAQPVTPQKAIVRRVAPKPFPDEVESIKSEPTSAAQESLVSVEAVMKDYLQKSAEFHDPTSPVSPETGIALARPLSPVESSPMSKSNTHSKAATLVSIYNQYKSPASKSVTSLPSAVTPKNPPLRPPPVPLIPANLATEVSTIRAQSIATTMSPDSANPGRQSMWPKGLFTPSKSQSGDLFLTVQYKNSPKPKEPAPQDA